MIPPKHYLLRLCRFRRLAREFRRPCYNLIVWNSMKSFLIFHLCIPGFFSDFWIVDCWKMPIQFNEIKPLHLSISASYKSTEAHPLWVTSAYDQQHQSILPLSCCVNWSFFMIHETPVIVRLNTSIASQNSLTLFKNLLPFEYFLNP